jgi:aconitase A
MKKIRCPYCIEAGGFRKLMHCDHSMVCDTCGHEVVDRPGFRCSCKKCAEQFSFVQHAQPARTHSRVTAPRETH